MNKDIYFEDVNIGDSIPTLVKEPVTKLQFVKYAGASGDFNPLHTDDDIGKMAGIGGVIAHGMLIMGFVGQAVTNWIPKKNLKKLNVRFAGMTKPGDTISVTGKVVDKNAENNIITCEVFAKDQNEQVKIQGSFEAKLPKKN
jgi:acyl dehydratase